MSNLIILYEYHEAPPFLVGNPYIRSGYRAYLPPKLCLKSLFIPNNETINIWSHLLVGIYFFYCYFSDVSLVGNYQGTTFYDRAAFVTMVITIQVSMFASAIYHLFNCHSADMCHRLLLVDCIGIGIGISGCFFPVMHYAFFCFPYLKVWYGVGIGLVFMIAGYLITRPWFRTNTFVRILTYSLLALSGIVPTAHWALLHGFRSEIVSIFLPRIGMLYATSGAGAFFYITMLPESLLPGRFDILGSSHQIWHICAATVFIVGHNTQQMLFQYVMNNPCPG